MRNFKRLLLLLIIIGTQTSVFALPNPASTNCLDKGNKYMLVQNVGICVFPDHSYCEEWAYFRGQCRPGQNKAVMGNTNLPGASLPSQNPPVQNGSTPP